MVVALPPHGVFTTFAYVHGPDADDHESVRARVRISNQNASFDLPATSLIPTRCRHSR